MCVLDRPSTPPAQGKKTGTGHGGSSMRLERRYTQAGRSPFSGMAFRAADSEIRNPDGSIVFQLKGVDVPADWSQVAADVLAQKYFRRAGVRRAPHQDRRARRAGMAVAFGARPGGTGRAARRGALRRRAQRPPGLPSHGRRLDLLGMEGRLLRQRGRRPHLLRRALLHAGGADLRAQLAAMVQHRPALGLRHRRSRPGPLVRRSPRRHRLSLLVGLRTAAAARLLHPERLRRSGERGRHHGSLGARGATLQVWLRHRLQLLGAARRRRAAGGRRPVVGPDVVPQGRRPRGGRHQVGRHDAARGQDGVGRHRPSRHRGLHRLEDAARSRRSPRWSPARGSPTGISTP